MAKKHLELPESLEGLEIIEEEVYPYCPLLSCGNKLRQCIACNCAAYNLYSNKCTLFNNKIKSFIRPHVRQK